MYLFMQPRQTGKTHMMLDHIEETVKVGSLTPVIVSRNESSATETLELLLKRGIEGVTVTTGLDGIDQEMKERDIDREELMVYYDDFIWHHQLSDVDMHANSYFVCTPPGPKSISFEQRVALDKILIFMIAEDMDMPK